jgi:hypothetical protein
MESQGFGEIFTITETHNKPLDIAKEISLDFEARKRMAYSLS